MPSCKDKKEVPRRCRCQPSCRNILTGRSRRRHSCKIQDMTLMLPSETVSNRDTISEADEHQFFALEDMEIIASDAASEHTMSINSSHSMDNVMGSPSVSDQEHYLEDDRAFVFNFGDNFYQEDKPQSELNYADKAEAGINFENVAYIEEEEIEGYGLLTVEQQQQQLEDEVGAEIK
jgi:hypothetical protein